MDSDPLPCPAPPKNSGARRIRAFVAATLAEPVKDAVAAFIAELKLHEASTASHARSSASRQHITGGAVAWVRRENFHLTLRFLGAAVDPALITPLTAALEQATSGIVPFVVSARGAGAFPTLSRPRTLWIGLESRELVTLAEKVEAAAVSSGFQRESRPYSPHLTIGRIRQSGAARTLAPALEAASARRFGDSRVDSITLFRSDLRPEGARYEALATFALRAGGVTN